MGYIGMCHSEGYGFQATQSGIGYRNQRVFVGEGIIFQEIDQLIEDFSLIGLKKWNQQILSYMQLILITKK